MTTWFAFSALTGRLHAFGDAPEPLPGGMGANALPCAIADADEAALPAALREPRALRAAQLWLAQWEGLSPSQRAAVQDRPAPLQLHSLAQPAPLPRPTPTRPLSPSAGPACQEPRAGGVLRGGRRQQQHDKPRPEHRATDHGPLRGGGSGAVCRVHVSTRRRRTRP